MSSLASKFIRLAPNWTNPGFFSEQISVHFYSSQNVLKSDLKKLPDLSHYGPMTNLTHFCVKPDIPALETPTKRIQNLALHLCIRFSIGIFLKLRVCLCLSVCVSQRLPPFLKNYSNPCFHDVDSRGGKVLRCLPYFYVLGMDKCGSTDLHSRMMIHPDIRGNRGSLNKETQYWSWSRYGNQRFWNIFYC